MNTPTPKTDEWETYCDEWYYHMWRLRRKTERGWHDGFHIQKGDEAKGLCDILNNLEAELTAVTEQRDGLRSGIDYASDQLSKVTEQRDAVTLRLGRTQEKMFDAERQRDRLLEQQEQWRLSSVCRELIEQRDRLAEALESIVGESAYEGLPELKQLAIEEALQSLTTNEL
jgi:hypothetical protein